MAITASMVKELKELTGAGMMDCKAALEACNSDFEHAKDWLRKKGIASAAKKSGRTAADGIIEARLYNDNQRAVMVEVNCETDFVAKTDDFVKLVEYVIGKVATVEPLPADPAGLPGDVEELRASTVGKLGENMVIRRFARYDLTTPGKLQMYIHPGNKLVVIAKVLCGKPETVATHEFQELCTDIGMQIAAAAPTSIDRSGLTKEILDRELEIAKEQARQTGKPEAVIEKIAQGKMEKIYSELCLLEQPFVKEPKLTVTGHIEEVAKKLGDTISIRDFSRFKIGE